MSSIHRTVDPQDQVHQMLASDHRLSREAKALVLAALHGTPALREYLEQMTATDELAAPPHVAWARCNGAGAALGLHGDRCREVRTAPVQLGGERSILHDALARYLGLTMIATAEYALSSVLREAKAARRRAIAALDEVRLALGGSTDPRAARMRALLAHAGTIDLRAVAELATALVGDDLGAVLRAEVPEVIDVRARVRRIRRAQEAAMGGAMPVYRDLPARALAYIAADNNTLLRAYQVRRTQLSDIRRELSELVAVYPEVYYLPGIDNDIVSRYLVARSAARALVMESRNADAVEARLVELTVALRSLQNAARAAEDELHERNAAWAPIAERLSRWMEQSREMRASAARVQALAEAEEWVVRSGKALCAAELGLAGSVSS